MQKRKVPKSVPNVPNYESEKSQTDSSGKIHKDHNSPFKTLPDIMLLDSRHHFSAESSSQSLTTTASTIIVIDKITDEV